jgi:hypothetical protein
MFTYVHGMLVVGLFGGGLKGAHSSFDAAALWRVIQENDLGWAILGLTVSRGISFMTNYIGKGEYQRASLQQLMSQPYGRIVVMHLAILFGGFIMLALHSPMVGLVLLVVLKTALDLSSHAKERKKFAENPPATNSITVGDEVTSL